MNLITEELAHTTKSSNKAIIKEAIARVGSINDLRVLKDQNTLNTLLRIYRDYVHDVDFRGFPRFLVEVNNLLTQFGARDRALSSEPDEEDDEEEEEKTVKKKRPAQRR